MATNSPKLYELVQIGAKVETTTGTAESITASECAMVVENPEWTVDPATIERQYPGALGQYRSQPGIAPATLKFRWRCARGSTGIPLFLSTFMGAFDMDLTTATYNCARLATTVTVCEWRDGIKRTLRGARGDFEIVGESGQPLMMDVTLMGCFVDEEDDDAPAPLTLPSGNAPLVDESTLTIGGYSPIGVKTVRIKRGNTLVMREDVTKHGYLGAAITSWKPTVELDPEMTALATKDWTSIRDAMTEAAFAFDVGATALNIWQFDAAAAQVQKTTIVNDQGKMKQNIVLQLNGSNPLTLTLA